MTTASHAGIIYIVDCREHGSLTGCGAVGSALPWGGRGRGFKSRHSDQLRSATPISSVAIAAEFFILRFEDIKKDCQHRVCSVDSP